MEVAFFRTLVKDMDARIQAPVEDQNGEKCALIKVSSNLDGLKFESPALGVTKQQVMSGETWVYVPAGSKTITVLCNKFPPLRNYAYPVTIESAVVYEMRIVGHGGGQMEVQDAGGNFLTMAIKPQNAIVRIDGVLQNGDASGDYSFFLEYGNHNYSVEAAGYVESSGTIHIGDETEHLDISLESKLASLSLSCETEGAQLYVDNQIRGTNSCSLNLPAGVHLIEAKKDGYQSKIQKISLSEKDNKKLVIQPLTPMYSSLVLNYKPNNSDVYIDGEYVGKTPGVFKKVLSGTRKVVIKKDGYEDYISETVLKEGESVKLNGTLNKAESKENKKESKESNTRNSVVKREVSIKKANDGALNFSMNGVDYKCKGNGDGTYCLTYFSRNAKDVIIPHMVTSGNDTYVISEIDVYRSGDTYSVVNLSVDEGIKVIGNYCFNEFTQLRKIKMPKSIVKLGKNAFGSVKSKIGGAVIVECTKKDLYQAMCSGSKYEF